MRVHNLFLLCSASLIVATPVARPQGVGEGADSCPSETLSPDTWNKLKIDDFLAQAAKNYTRTTTNNIQSLASSFGAPNFFCGLDNFCNAGQPCLPIQLPAWYAAIGIQNWNNYMNGLNTAINFAASIISLKLPEIVQDFYPDPKDDITPLKNIGSMFSAILGVIPFTGPVATGAGVVKGGLSFVLARAQPPKPIDRFLAWSNVASSTGDIVKEYQATIATTIKNILDAPIDDPNNGINGVLKGGEFLGLSQNFTQTDLQNQVIDAITLNAVGLALQAQGVFINRLFNTKACRGDEDAGTLCRMNDGDAGTSTTWIMTKKQDRHDNAANLADIAQKIMDKHGLTKDQMLKGPTDCFDANGKNQLTNPFDTDSLPADPKGQCVFNLLICDSDTQNPCGKGIVECCRDKGLPI